MLLFSAGGVATAAAVPAIVSPRPGKYYSRPPLHARSSNNVLLIGRHHHISTNMTIATNYRSACHIVKPAVMRYRPYYCSHTNMR